MMAIISKAGWIGILLTIIFTVYSQTVIKWKMSSAHDMPKEFTEIVGFLFSMLINPWIATSILATLFAGLSWMFVMSKVDLSVAYPFISLVYVVMMMIGIFAFNEPVGPAKVCGVLLIMLGVAILGRS